MTMQTIFFNSEEHNNDVNIDCKHVQTKAFNRSAKDKFYNLLLFAV